MLTRIKRFNILVKLQLSEVFSKRSFKKPSQIFKMMVVMAIIFFALLYGTQVLINVITQGAKLNLSPLTEFFLSVIFIFQIIELVNIISGLSSSLYKNEQNKILITFPVNGPMIYLSKLTAYYLRSLLKNVLIMFPIFIAYGKYFQVFSHYGFLYVFKSLLISIMLPLFMVLLGAFLTTPVTFIGSLFKRSTIASFILAFSIVGVIIYFIHAFITNLQGADGMINHVEFYNRINIMIKEKLPKFNYPSLFIKNFYRFLFAYRASDSFLNLGYLAIYFLGLLVFGIILSMFVYIKLSSYIFEETTKRKYKPTRFSKKIHSKYITYLVKELKIVFRSSETAISTIMYLAILPISHFFLSYLFKSFNLSGRGIRLTTTVMLLIGLLIVTTSNHLSASIITREGDEFYLTKVIPTDIKKLIAAKLTINFGLVFFTILFDLVMLLFIKQMPTMTIIKLTGILLIVAFVHIVWSAEIDILNPEHKMYGELKTLDYSKNIQTSMAIGITLSLLLVLSYMSRLGIMLTYGIGLTLLCYRLVLINKKLDFYYKDTE